MPTHSPPMQTLPAKPTLNGRSWRHKHTSSNAIMLQWRLLRADVFRASASEPLADGGASRLIALVGWGPRHGPYGTRVGHHAARRISPTQNQQCDYTAPEFRRPAECVAHTVMVGGTPGPAAFGVGAGRPACL
jgi:hypothetical protein